MSDGSIKAWSYLRDNISYTIIMYCNNSIHIELVDDGYIECPFCDQETGEQLVKKDTCCDNQNMTKDDKGAVIKFDRYQGKLAEV